MGVDTWPLSFFPSLKKETIAPLSHIVLMYRGDDIIWTDLNDDMIKFTIMRPLISHKLLVVDV